MATETDIQKSIDTEMEAELAEAQSNPRLTVCELTNGLTLDGRTYKHFILRAPTTRDMVSRDLLAMNWAAANGNPEGAQSPVLLNVALLSIVVVRAAGLPQKPTMDQLMTLSRLDSGRMVGAYERLEDQLENPSAGN